MRSRRPALAALVVMTLIASAGSGCDELQPETGDVRMACVDGDSDPGKTVSFKDDIRPLMNGAVPGTKGCKSCHYDLPGTTKEGLDATGLNLETLRTLKLGGRQTPPNFIVVPGSPCKSAIVKKLQGTFGEARMPKGGPYWTAAQIQLMIDWIFEGANGDPAD